MTARIADLRCKEVVNVRDGARLGYLSDVEIDTVSGRVVSIIVPGKSGLFAFGDEYSIPWDAICRIGEDIILVDFEFCQHPPKEKRRLF